MRPVLCVLCVRCSVGDSERAEQMYYPRWGRKQERWNRFLIAFFFFSQLWFVFISKNSHQNTERLAANCLNFFFGLCSPGVALSGVGSSDPEGKVSPWKHKRKHWIEWTLLQLQESVRCSKRYKYKKNLVCANVVVQVWNPGPREAEAGRITSLKPVWATEWELVSHKPKYFVLWVWIKIYLVVSIQRQIFPFESLPLWKCHFCSSIDFCFVSTEYVQFLHFVVRLQLRGSIMWAQGGTSCFMLLHVALWALVS